MSNRLFGAPYQMDELGMLQEISLVRSKVENIRSAAQYGGAASTLISFALDESIIDAAVLTESDSSLLPQGRLVTNRRQVLECAGTNYMVSPTIERFNIAAKGDTERLGVVGTPCQVMALAKMRASTITDRNPIDKLKLVVGLFCTWGLSCLDFWRFLKDKLDIDSVRKFDIPPPPANVFVVYTNQGHMAIPLEEVRRFILPACFYCLDMTAEFSDISVGAAEGIEGWNTVIVRSNRGAEIFEKARASGLIEVKTFPQANLAYLKGAVRNKKKRALENIADKTGNTNNLLYIEGSPKHKEMLLNLINE
jgi:coenzyme F420 hydrogenase subunit beta